MGQESVKRAIILTICCWLVITHFHSAIYDSDMDQFKLNEKECQELKKIFLKKNDSIFSNCKEFLKSLKKSYISKYEEDGDDKFVSDLFIAFKKINRNDLADVLTFEDVLEQIEEVKENSLSHLQNAISLKDRILSNDFGLNPLKFINRLFKIQKNEHSTMNDVFKIIFLITIITIIQTFTCCYFFRYCCPVLYKDLKRTAFEALTEQKI